MTTSRSILCVLAILLSRAIPVYAQCSDAGVCSLGGPEEPSHQLVISGAVSYGKSSDEDLGYTDYQLGLRGMLSEDLSMSFGVPYRTMSGPLGSTTGIGDILVTGRYRVWSGEDMSASVEVGARIATGSVNKGQLPQAYQPGLGTSDALIGISLSGGRWSTSLGYQYAPGRSANSVNQLRRGDDISLRGTYTISDETTVIAAEVILIHKLRQSDGYYLRTTSGAYQFAPGGSGIPGTDRTQINLAGDLAYPLSTGMTLNVRAAMALRARPVNVDGLKRNYTVQAGVSVPLL